MSDIRFNRWLHQSGTGGVYQDSSGRVGIGTSVPTTALDVQSGTIKIGSNTLSSTGVSTFSGGIIVGTGASISSPATNVLTLGTNNTESVRIISSGFVGVGTASPASPLEVQSSGIPRIISNYNNSKHIGMSVGGSGGGLTLTDGHFLTINHQPYADRGTDNNFTERLRIDSSGNLLFNSGYGSAATAYGVRAWVRFNGTGTVSTNQTINGSGNVSTVYKNATGDYTVNFTNAFVDANYAVTHAGGIQSVEWGIHLRHNSVAPTTSAYRFKNVTTADADRDVAFINVAFYR